MKDQLKIITLINEIDQIAVDEYFAYDFYDDYNSYILEDFGNKLLDIFEDGLNEDILRMISKLEKKEIFKIDTNTNYNNNIIRQEIEKYLDENDYLYFDYELIIDNIKQNYNLAKYVKDKSKLVDLVDLNEKVMLVIASRYATEELVLNTMKKSNILSQIFLGKYGNTSQVYRYSDFYKDSEEINNLLYEQLKNILIEDCTLYIKASNLVKHNKMINELVISIDPRIKAYIL